MKSEAKRVAIAVVSGYLEQGMSAAGPDIVASLLPLPPGDSAPAEASTTREWIAQMSASMEEIRVHLAEHRLRLAEAVGAIGVIAGEALQELAVRSDRSEHEWLADMASRMDDDPIPPA